MLSSVFKAKGRNILREINGNRGDAGTEIWSALVFDKSVLVLALVLEHLVTDLRLRIRL